MLCTLLAPLLHIHLLLRFMWRQRFREDDCCQENNRSSGCPLGCSAVHGLFLQGTYLQHPCAFISFLIHWCYLSLILSGLFNSLTHAAGCVSWNVCACLDTKEKIRWRGGMARARGGTKDKIRRRSEKKNVRERYVFPPLLRPLWLCNAVTVWKQQVRPCRAGGI